MKRKIAPAILIVACLILAALAFRNLQLQAPRHNVGASRIFPGMAGAPVSPASSAERAEAINSIQGQLDAFRNNDYAKAEYYQSPMLRFSTGSVQRFQSMMQDEYPEFTNSARANFGEGQSMMGGEEVVIPVQVTGKNGITVNAVYTLQRGPDGIYRVMSVEVGQH